MRLSDFDVLTFDLIGTLIDFETGVLDFVRPRILPLRPEVSDDELLRCYTRVQAEVRKADPGLLFSGRMVRTWEVMAAEYGVETTPEDGRLIVQSARNWPAFADAPAALAELRRHFRFLVVVTNGDRVSARAMAARLGSPFSEIITEEDMGFAKPDPRAFAWFIDHLGRQGVRRDRILHVAQSQYHDIGAAKAAGLATAWIYRRHGKAGHGGTQEPARYTAPDLVALGVGELARRCLAELTA
jgi:2-haloalkanoic acid dehalogenase type II